MNEYVDRLWKSLEDERLEKTREFRDEADQWQREGDWFGWNFHQGRSSGTIEASFIYDRMRKELETCACLLMSAHHLLIAATGPEDGPTSWSDTRQKWIDEAKERIK